MVNHIACIKSTNTKRKKISMKWSCYTKQHGVVLVVSLIFLVALTATAVALMQNTTTDMKMSGATEMRSEAIQASVSAIDEVIFNQVTSSNTNLFTTNPATGFTETNQTVLLPGTLTGATASVQALPQNELPGDENNCSTHHKDGYDIEGLTCIYFRVDVTRTYGRNGTSVLTTRAGIQQRVRKSSGNE